MKNLLKPLFVAALMFAANAGVQAQGWPENYEGVMLQGFYWDSYADTQWDNLSSQAEEMSEFFDLIWVPNSAYAGSLTSNMGYHPIYWFDHKSAFGSEEALRSMIKTFKEKGTGIIEDVVINHRLGVSSWVDFPAETVNGVTYQLTASDICSGDEAKDEGYTLGQNADTGQNWGGARDLDHKSENVQKNVVAYLDYLKNNLGYVGFRYDFVLGYAPEYVGKYNQTVKPEFSVAECWESYTIIRNWLNGTKVDDVIQSAAFDFPLKFIIRDAFNASDWSKLAGTGTSYLAYLPSLRRYSVTFLDNHDTGREDDKMLKANVEAANAFMLMLPGTPCVWLSHWKKYKAPIKKMILLRHAAGITNQSAINANNYKVVDNGFVAETKGTKGNVMILLGDVTSQSTEGYKLALEGENYKLYVSEGVDISALDDIVDDEPSVNIPSFCTVGADEMCAFFEAPQTWSTIKCWCWNSSSNFTGGTWPGALCQYLGKAENGNEVYKWTYSQPLSTVSSLPTGIIFSSNGAPQTIDLPFENGGYYNIDGLQATVTTGIDDILINKDGAPSAIYDLQGRCVKKPAVRGIYIVNGRKVVR